MLFHGQSSMKIRMTMINGEDDDFPCAANHRSHAVHVLYTVCDTIAEHIVCSESKHLVCLRDFKCSLLINLNMHSLRANNCHHYRLFPE